MSQEFDLVVVGSGTTAKNAAYACNDAGWDVAVIDSRPFGGTCVLRGCDPKKVLVGIAEAVDKHNRHLDKGIRADPAEIDWSSAMAFKQTFVDGVSEGTEQALIDAGIETFHGRARFVDERSIQVGDEQLQG
ncbi:MAG: FAD-dependent oxidoreductase, partial [Anaerolineales bacterium]|nr:FAD-dependent oxidoreductase [Anaerolineales bacterium]